MLKQNAGTDLDDPRIERLVNGVRGFAASLEASDMFGRGSLDQFASAEDFLAQFLQRYQEKAEIDMASKKRAKAETPQAIARAEQDRQKVQQGLQMVQQLFQR